MGKCTLYHDEVVEIPLYSRPIGDFVTLLWGGMVQSPPLFGILQHFWIKAFGTAEAALRSFALLFSLMGLPVFFLFAMRLFDKGVAFVAASLYAVSPFIILWARVSRWYSLMMFLSLLSTYFFFLWLRERNRSISLLYTISITLCLYTNYYAVSLILAHNLIWMIYGRPSIRRWLLMQVIIMVLFLPWLPALIRHLQASMNYLQQPGVLGYIPMFFYVIYACCFGETLYPWRFLMVIPGVLAVFIICFNNILLLIKRTQYLRPQIAVIALFMIPVVLGLLTNTLNTARAYPFAPYFLLLLAYGLTELRIRWVKFITGVVLFFTLMVSLFNYHTGREFLKPGLVQPWREAMEYLEENVGARDTVLYSSEVLGFYIESGGYPGLAGSHVMGAYEWLKNEYEIRPGEEVWWIESSTGNVPSLIRLRGDVRGLLDERCEMEDRSLFMEDKDLKWKMRLAPSWDFPRYRIGIYKFRCP